MILCPEEFNSGLFGVNENVARQTRGARWEAEQEANGDADLE